MAVLTATNPTLLDLAKSKDPDGKIAQVVEILNQTNEILDDMSWIEGNMTDGHRTTVRVGLPTPTWRKLNEGVLPDKGLKQQIVAKTGVLEGFSEVDVTLAQMSTDVAGFRLQEDASHMEGMNQEVASTLFYGNEGTAPEEFTGFAPQFNSLSNENADNIIDAGGTGADNQSIWLVVWASDTCHGIIPKGTTAGLQMEDLGIETKENVGGVTGSLMRVYRTNYSWKVGLVVKDWRYVVRIANIDKSLLSTTYTAGAFTTGANLPLQMFKAMRLIPNLSRGRAAFYMSRDTATTLHQQVAASVQNSTLTAENVGGRMVERFHGIPLRRVDALAGNEAQVT